MNDTILRFIWIPLGAILLVLLINTFVVPQSVLKNSDCRLLKNISEMRQLRETKHMSLFSAVCYRRWECFMRDITAALLAIVFVLYSLIALLSVDLNQDSTSSPLVSNQERISELGLRVAFQRQVIIPIDSASKDHPCRLMVKNGAHAA